MNYKLHLPILGCLIGLQFFIPNIFQDSKFIGIIFIFLPMVGFICAFVATLHKRARVDAWVGLDLFKYECDKTEKLLYFYGISLFISFILFGYKINTPILPF